MNLEELMASTPPMQQHALINGFQAGAASRDAEIAELVELYEQALTASWPDGAMGDAFDFWNAARKVRKP